MTSKQYTDDQVLRPPVCVRPGSDIRAAAQRMSDAGISSVLVGAPGGLVSILTERDITRAVARGESLDRQVEDVAVPAPLTIEATATALDAARAMLDGNVRHLVVTRDRQAVAVISMRDVLGALASDQLASDQLSSDQQVLLAGVSPGGVARPERWWG